MTHAEYEAAAAAFRRECGLAEPPPPLATPGEIRALRRALKLKQRDFAALIGLTCYHSIGGWEQGKHPVRPKPAIAARLRPLLDRARERGLLIEPPRREKKPVSLYRYRCGGACGRNVREHDLVPDEERGGIVTYHHWMRGQLCGPVQVEDRTRRKVATK